MMKKALLLLLVIVNCLGMGIPVAAHVDLTTEKGALLQVYTQQELESTVFTMDKFHQAWSEDELRLFLMADKAQQEPSTYEFMSYDISDSELQDVYSAMEVLAATSPGLAYYFSLVYWRYREDSYYGANTISLTLVPTEVTENNRDREVTLASWTLVKAMCQDSPHWYNEGSLQQQYDCHALGEALGQDVGDWDLEPIRKDTGLIQFAVNRCNPEGEPVLNPNG